MVTSVSLSDIRVAVIGAGAAGVAAARRLRAAGLSVCVLEARGRVGGRAHTIYDSQAGPLDLGCKWLHSADLNPVVDAARALGLTIDTSRPDWGSHVGGGFPPDARADFQAASSCFWSAAERAAQDGGPDRAASTVLEPGNRWNPLIEAISSYYNGVALSEVSLVDLDRYVDTGVNWRIAEGYGTFVEQAASGLDLRLDCTVHTIDHSGPALKLETSQGALTAHAAIVTLPTDVLAAGGLAFRPALPTKVAAAAALPLGVADKLYFAVRPGADLPSGHLFGTTDSADTISFDIGLRGRPVVEGFLGGAFARALEAEGPAAFEAAARAQLRAMLGADIDKDLTFLRATAWARDPFSLGSYSHARPGFADQRAVLSEPVGERLYFAGEACSRTFFSTAHGAWQTGIDAADAILAQRGLP